MNTLINTILIFIELFEYLIIFDIILSWLTLFGIKFRPKFIRDLVDPIYKKIKKTIPTTIGYFDFSAFIIIITLEIIKFIILMTFTTNLI